MSIRGVKNQVGIMVFQKEKRKIKTGVFFFFFLPYFDIILPILLSQKKKRRKVFIYQKEGMPCSLLGTSPRNK